LCLRYLQLLTLSVRVWFYKMKVAGIVILFCIAFLNILICHGLKFHRKQNISMQDNISIEEEEREMQRINIYDTDTMEDVVHFMDDPDTVKGAAHLMNDTDNLEDITDGERQIQSMEVGTSDDFQEDQVTLYELSYNGGETCGTKKENEAISIHNVEISDPIVLGGNVTFAADVEVNTDHKTATLLSVVMQKEGVRIPCINGIGSCNYTNPCDLLEKIQCPNEIIEEGWDCRCPFLAHQYSFPPVTGSIPSVTFPAFLVDGMYHITFKLFDGDEELLCYKIQVEVRKKEMVN